jgi:hypothetical protein
MADYVLLIAVNAIISGVSTFNTLFLIAQSIDKNILPRYNKSDI